MDSDSDDDNEYILSDKLSNNDINALILYNEASRLKLIDNIRHLICNLPKPNKITVSIKYLRITTNNNKYTIVDYTYLDLQISSFFNNYDKLSYYNKQILSNLIHFSKLLEDD